MRCALLAQDVAINIVRLEAEGLKASREDRLARKVQEKRLTVENIL